MAANAVIGALRVNLSLNSAQFESGLKTANSKLEKFGKGLKAGLAAAGTAAVAAFGAMSLAIKGTLNQADELYKTSQKIGIPIEQLSRLKYAAELSGLEMDRLTQATSKLAVGMQNLANGKPDEAGKALMRLGISATDSSGKLRTAEDVIRQLADKFSMMEDGVEKTAAASRIFGERVGRDMIPFLNQGSVAIAALGAEAQALGLVFSKETGQAAEQFNDNIARLGKLMDGFFIQITAKIAPVLNVLVQKLYDWIQAQGGVERAMQTFQPAIDLFNWALKEAAIFTVELTGVQKELGIVWETLVKTVEALIDLDLSKALEAAADGMDRIKKNTEETTKAVNDLRSALDSAAAAGNQMGTLPGGPLNAGTVRPGMGGGQLPTTNAGGDIETVRLADGEEVRVHRPSMSGAVQSGVGGVASGVAQSNRSLAELMGYQQYADNAAANQRGRIISALDAGFAGLRDDFKTAGFLEGRAQFGDKQYTSTIGGFFGGNFATGGSFKVPGSGGIDSQLVVMRATPGEMVEVTPRGRMGGDGGDINVTMHINGVTDPNGFRNNAYQIEQEARRLITRAAMQSLRGA